MQEVAHIGRLALRGAAASLQARSKVLHVLVAVEQDVARCTTIAACVSEMCRWLMAQTGTPALEMRFCRDNQAPFAVLDFWADGVPLPPPPEQLRRFAVRSEPVQSPDRHGFRLCFRLHRQVPAGVLVGMAS